MPTTDLDLNTIVRAIWKQYLPKDLMRNEHLELVTQDGMSVFRHEIADSYVVVARYWIDRGNPQEDWHNRVSAEVQLSGRTVTMHRHDEHALADMLIAEIRGLIHRLRPEPPVPVTLSEWSERSGMSEWDIERMMRLEDVPLETRPLTIFLRGPYVEPDSSWDLERIENERRVALKLIQHRHYMAGHGGPDRALRNLERYVLKCDELLKPIPDRYERIVFRQETFNDAPIKLEDRSGTKSRYDRTILPIG